MTTVRAYLSFSTLKYMVLPLLLAVFPALFFYGINVAKLLLPSLGRMLLFYSVLALLIFGACQILFSGKTVKAANAAFVFLLFFHLYGLVYNVLLDLDLFRVEHYTLLPLFLLAAIYTSRSVGTRSGIGFWNTATLILACLVVFNLVRIIPGEIRKQRSASQSETITPPETSTVIDEDHPDIYFIIFDEFAGLDTMRSYWDYQDVDEFVDFVQSRGFFVAEASRSRSTVTLHLMAELLNYRKFPVDDEDVDLYYNDINHSRAVRHLESLGYTTVTFDETRYWYDTYSPMPADYPFFYDDANETMDLGVLFDEFGVLVAENTMLKAFESFYKPRSAEAMVIEQHREYILFTAEKIGQLADIPSPKFVYVHLMVPHNPFIFDANGDRVDPLFYQNWNYYLDQYKFTVRLMEGMIDDILQGADPERPPVIIIQSDHGARNGLAAWHTDAVTLKDYPPEYANHILNIMFLPGLDTSQLPQDIKPINTFPIIFNHYFGTDIPLVK